MSYDDGSEAFRLRQEFRREFYNDNVPKFGDDWRKDVFSGKVSAPNAGFVWDKDYILVSWGRIKNSDCGSFKKWMGCLRRKLHAELGFAGKINVKAIFWSCNRPECPVCGVYGWAAKVAKAAEERLLFASKRKGLPIEHIIQSLDKKYWDLPLDEKRVLCRNACYARGIIGGNMIYHHFRFHHADETYVGEPAHWFKAPHFHLLAMIKGGFGCRSCSYYDSYEGSCLKGRGADCNGFAAVSMRANVKDGFITKVKDERKTVGGTIWYQLSHASLRVVNGVTVRNQRVVTWFGVMNRNELKLRKGELTQRENLCVICHEPMYLVHFRGSKDDFKELLAYIRACGRNRHHVLDEFDKDGNPFWERVQEFG